MWVSIFLSSMVVYGPVELLSSTVLHGCGKLRTSMTLHGCVELLALWFYKVMLKFHV